MSNRSFYCGKTAMQWTVSCSQCTSARAANKGGQCELSWICSLRARAPPFITHELLRKDGNAAGTAPTLQCSQEVHTLTAPIKKAICSGRLGNFQKDNQLFAGVQVSGVSNELGLVGTGEPCHQSHRSCSVSFSSLESSRFRSSWL